MSKYDDIINLPHYEPKNHKRMSIESRSAQFAPFSALTGYEDEVKETARLTEKEVTLTNEQKLIINEKLNFLKDKDINVKVIYFIKDNKKSGGKYFEKYGIIKKIDYLKMFVMFDDKFKLDMNSIIEIQIDNFYC